MGPFHLGEIGQALLLTNKLAKKKDSSTVKLNM